MTTNSFGSRDRLIIGDTTYLVHMLDRIDGTSRLPYSLDVLLENLSGNEDGLRLTADQVRALASWDLGAARGSEVAYTPVVVPPDTGICHQVNLEYLSRVAFTQAGADGLQASPDTLSVPTHTPPWSTGSESWAGASVVSRPRPRCSASPAGLGRMLDWRLLAQWACPTSCVSSWPTDFRVSWSHLRPPSASLL